MYVNILVGVGGGAWGPNSEARKKYSQPTGCCVYGNWTLNSAQGIPVAKEKQ